MGVFQIALLVMVVAVFDNKTCSEETTVIDQASFSGASEVDVDNTFVPGVTARLSDDDDDDNGNETYSYNTLSPSTATVNNGEAGGNRTITSKHTTPTQGDATSTDHAGEKAHGNITTLDNHEGHVSTVKPEVQKGTTANTPTVEPEVQTGTTANTPTVEPEVQTGTTANRTTGGGTAPLSASGFVLLFSALASSLLLEQL